MKNAHFMHVIAGKYKGKKILIPSQQSTRSSKSILRESLFNTLSLDIRQSEFIELFGGSGSVMLEALSRGAKKAYAIELDDEAYKILGQNLAFLPKEDYEIFHASCFEIFSSLEKKLTSKTYIYVDPPFVIRENMQNIYNDCFDMLKIAKNDNIKCIIFEHMSKFNMPENIGKYAKSKTKKFGKSSLSYYI